MKIAVLLSALLSLFAVAPPVEVRVAGEMKKIMQKGDLSAHIALDTLLRQDHLYGLGPAEGIKGELLILDSKAYWCRAGNKGLETRVENSARAAMLVYARVPAWKTVPVPNAVSDYAALEKTIATLAAANGQSLQEPFPFLVTGKVTAASWHVIDWKDGVPHTFDNHKQFARFGNSNNETVTLLGFYSGKHHSIFTHHSTNMHVHILDEKKSIVGHLEEWTSGTTALTLSIPK